MKARTNIKSLLLEAGYSIVDETEIYIEGIKPLGFNNLYYRIRIVF